MLRAFLCLIPLAIWSLLTAIFIGVVSGSHHAYLWASREWREERDTHRRYPEKHLENFLRATDNDPDVMRSIYHRRRLVREYGLGMHQHPHPIAKLIKLLIWSPVFLVGAWGEAMLDEFGTRFQKAWGWVLDIDSVPFH